MSFIFKSSSVVISKLPISKSPISKSGISKALQVFIDRFYKKFKGNDFISEDIKRRLAEKRIVDIRNDLEESEKNFRNGLYEGDIAALREYAEAAEMQYSEIRFRIDESIRLPGAEELTTILRVFLLGELGFKKISTAMINVYPIDTPYKFKVDIKKHGTEIEPLWVGYDPTPGWPSVNITSLDESKQTEVESIFVLDAILKHANGSLFDL